MVTARGRRLQLRRVLFVRVGRMHNYNGPVPGDERPVGGGRYNKNKIGHEVYNFRKTKGRLYGYFQPPKRSRAVALERIDPNAADADKLNNVLVVYVAPDAESGQVIVGWYGDAEVLRKQAARSPGKPRRFGHFCSALQARCFLLPDENRNHQIPFGKGGMGQSNICYSLDADGATKRVSWIQRALKFIDDYRGSNILAKPEAAAERESAAAAEKALARSQGQGFARTPQERRALEDHAMSVAKRYFRQKRFHVEDVSSRYPYDLRCTRARKELHVEVKGTTTDGNLVVLTNNEVKHACRPHNSCALFILHSIRLKDRRASGGKQRILHPWRLQKRKLTPVSYTYRL